MNSDKICVIKNNKCVEKYPSKSVFSYYYFCSKNKGINKIFCEVIQSYIPSSHTASSPLRNYLVSPNYSSRCVYGEFGCEKNRKNVRKQLMKLYLEIFL